MGEKEERELLRQIAGMEPDKIDAAHRMRARAWVCSKCGHVTNSEVAIKIPAPCIQCGGIAFRVASK
jgi:hypothetical protein